MPVPIVYRKSAENIISSYNFTDIAEGTGYVNFLTFNCYQGGAAGAYTYHLAESSPASDAIVTDNPSLNFDTTEFNLPRIIKGTAFIKFSGAITTTDAVTFTMALQKVSGGVTTTLGTSESYQLTGVAQKTFVVRIVIAQTGFKEGDILRLNVTHTKGGGTAKIAHDPLNRDLSPFTAATNPTKMEVFIPFKIDL